MRLQWLQCNSATRPRVVPSSGAIVPNIIVPANNNQLYTSVLFCFVYIRHHIVGATSRTGDCAINFNYFTLNKMQFPDYLIQASRQRVFITVINPCKPCLAVPAIYAHMNVHGTLRPSLAHRPYSATSAHAYSQYSTHPWPIRCLTSSLQLPAIHTIYGPYEILPSLFIFFVQCFVLSGWELTYSLL